MKFLNLFLGFYFLIIYPLYSQTYFEKTYGSSFDDEAYFIEPTNDNGFVITGRSKASAGTDYDIFILKINAVGTQEWFTLINNPSGDDWGRAVRQTADNGYIVGGEYSVVGGLDYTLAKFDANGTLTWQKRYNGNVNDRPSFLNVTSDGGFLMCGYSESSPAVNVDAFLLKTDNAGTIEWAKHYDGGNNDVIYGFSEINNGYITTGYTQSYGTGTSSGFINKIDNTGALVWTKVQSFNTGYNGFFYCSPYNSNFFTTRETDAAGIGGREIWVYAFDGNGTEVISKAYGTSNYDEAFGIALTTNGDYVVSGFTTIGGATGNNGSVFRCDVNGNLLWSKSYGGNGDDKLFDVKTIGNTGHVVCGYKTNSGNNDIYILRIDNDGNAGPTCSYNSAGFSSTDHIPTITSPTPSGNDYNTTNTVTLVSNQPSITTTDLCQSVVCNLNNNLLPSYQLCNNNAITLDAQNTGSTYLWSTGATSQTISVSSTGNYWVDITQGSCSLRVETTISTFSISGGIGNDQLICPGEYVTLKSPSVNSAYTYLWSNGDTNANINVNKPGEYYLTISLNTCSVRTNTVTITARDANHLFPNLITRNKDGKNDVLQLHSDFLGGNLLISNRWGSTVYQNPNYQNEFDGTGLNDGIYYYYYKSYCGDEYKGWVQIISN